MTLYSCVSTWPDHIFFHQIHKNPIRTISHQHQFTHISIHEQSSVLLHHSTTFKELLSLLSSVDTVENALDRQVYPPSCCYCWMLLFFLFICDCESTTTTKQEQKQHYKVTTILMWTKRFHNLCRLIYLLLLLLLLLCHFVLVHM